MSMHGPLLLSRASLDVHGRKHAVRALELSGHRASMRLPCDLTLDDDVRLTVGWSDGTSTTLPGRVRDVAPIYDDTEDGGGEHLACLDVEGVEGDWRPFLEYLGPAALAS